MVAWSCEEPQVAIVAGVRTPFVKIGDALSHVPVTELARIVFQETMARTGKQSIQVDEVFLGNVAMPADAANPARVATIQANLGIHTPAVTVGRNCASGMEAIAQAATAIASGRSKVIMAGGAESMSNIPLLFPRSAGDAFARVMRARTFSQRFAAFAAFRPRHFKPVIAIEQGLTDPTCGLIMGKTAEVLANDFNISREQQDAYALQSHQRAIAAQQAGHFQQQIVSVYAGKDFKPVSQDIGPREGQSIEALARLRPYFDRKFGSVTVGNSCQVTDGAAAMLLMHAEHAAACDLPAQGFVKAWAVSGVDPRRMGIGPVWAMHELLSQTGLSLGEIDLFEINEAFAAQVLACKAAMASVEYCKTSFGREEPIGEIDDAKLNISGGAIALGHPVGASGARLVLSLLQDLHRLGKKRGIAALCVGGGQGMAILVENASI